MPSRDMHWLACEKDRFTGFSVAVLSSPQFPFHLSFPFLHRLLFMELGIFSTARSAVNLLGLLDRAFCLTGPPRAGACPPKDGSVCLPKLCAEMRRFYCVFQLLALLLAEKYDKSLLSYRSSKLFRKRCVENDVRCPKCATETAF